MLENEVIVLFSIWWAAREHFAVVYNSQATGNDIAWLSHTF